MDTDTINDLGGLVIDRDTSTFIKLTATLAIILVAWLINHLANRFILRRVEDPKSQYWAKKAKTYLIVAIAFISIWWVWIAGLRSVATFLGLLAAGLAIALKEPLGNIAGWLFIIIRRPFQVGDRIQIGDHIGDVADLRVFQFSLLEIGSWVDADQMTGRVIHIPNGWVFQQAQINYAIGLSFIFDELPILITFESDWEKAKHILSELATRHSIPPEEMEKVRREIVVSDFMVENFELDTAVYTSVEDSGVLLTIRYICDPRKRRQAAQTMWESVLLEFAKHPDIDLAYPTTRFYTLYEEQSQAGYQARPREKFTHTPST